MTTDAATDESHTFAVGAAEADADARAERAWSLRIYAVVLLSFVLWVVALVVLQRTYS